MDLLTLDVGEWGWERPTRQGLCRPPDTVAAGSLGRHFQQRERSVYMVGLTGGIGSGKSTVAQRLAEHGCVVIDADKAARAVVEPGEPALEEIAERFGPDVIGSDGRLDRQGLADIVFADEASRRDLEAITHPRIGERIQAQIAEVIADEERDGVERIVVLDHPLLVETGLAKGLETVIVVTAPESVRVERLVERGLRADDAEARIRAQANDEARASLATDIIDNSGSMDHLHEQVDELHSRLTSRMAAT